MNDIALNERARLAKERVAIEQIVGQVVPLKRAGREFVGLCPFHTEKSPSFTVSPEKGFAHCFGCGWNGDVIKFLRDHQGVSFIDALTRLESNAGIEAQLGQRGNLQVVTDNPEREASLAGYAMRIWKEARDTSGTLAERYLMSRGVGIGVEVADIRFHSRCPFGKDSGDHQRYVPAMVALVRDPVTREPMGIHRTELTPDGRKVDRKMLGRCHGGVVMLAPYVIDSGIGITEGIETGLAVIALGGGAVWSCLSTGGIEKFPLLGGVQQLTIFADNDRSGIESAQKCARRWTGAGLNVAIQAPEEQGWDYADVLAAHKQGDVA